MQNVSPNRRTNIHDFLLDLLDFIEEQIVQAKSNSEDQHAAIDAARGVVPLIRDRLKEDDHLNAVFMLVFHQQIEERSCRDWWEKFASCTPEEFPIAANKLLGEGGQLRALKRRLGG
jgi:uncharacterized protein (DUF2267 family)